MPCFFKYLGEAQRTYRVVAILRLTSSALVSYPAGFLSDVIGRKYILLSSFIIFFLTYLGFALTHNIVIIATLFIFYGCYQGIFRSVGKAMVIDFVPSGLQASGIGWYAATIGLLQLIASIFAGLLWDSFSHEAVFMYGAIFALIGSALLIRIIPRK